jgi:hypothetical protein
MTQVALFYDIDKLNSWLQEIDNAKTEIVDIKFATFKDTDLVGNCSESFLVIYKK